MCPHTAVKPRAFCDAVALETVFSYKLPRLNVPSHEAVAKILVIHVLHFVLFTSKSE